MSSSPESYNPIPDQMPGHAPYSPARRFGKVKAIACAAVAGTALYGGYDIYQNFNGESGSEIKGEDTDLGIVIEKAVAQASFEVGILESSVDGQSKLAIDLANHEIPGSGFVFKIEDGTAGESNDGKNTAAKVETRVSIEADDVTINRNADTYQVVVDASKVNYYSRPIAGQHTVVSQSNTLAAAGEGIAKFGTALKKLFGADNGSGLDQYTERIRSIGTAFTQDLMLAKVDQQCAPQATAVVQDLFEKSFQEFAAAEGIKPEQVEVVWTGELQPNILENYGLDSTDGRDKGATSIRVQDDSKIETTCAVAPKVRDSLLSDEERAAGLLG